MDRKEYEAMYLAFRKLSEAIEESVGDTGIEGVNLFYPSEDSRTRIALGRVLMFGVEYTQRRLGAPIPPRPLPLNRPTDLALSDVTAPGRVAIYLRQDHSREVWGDLNRHFADLMGEFEKQTSAFPDLYASNPRLWYVALEPPLFAELPGGHIVGVT